MEKELILKAKELRNNGLSYGQIAAQLFITKSKANYLCKQDLEELDKKDKRRQDFEEKVCYLVKKSKSRYEVCKMLDHIPTNEYYKQIQRIIDKYSLDTSHFSSRETSYEVQVSNKKQTIIESLENGVKIPSYRIKQRLIKEGFREAKCECCGRIDWNGQPIPLQLHHINGNREDNRLENLQILCPNCHAQTDNYCKNKVTKGLNHCTICGKEISKNATYCVSCYRKLNHQKESNVVKQDRETILLDFKEFGSFDALSKKYKTSHNTIRKWCYEYGIPTTSVAMRNYIRSIYGDVKWKFSNGNPKILEEIRKLSFKPKCLMSDDGTVVKIYYSDEELISDKYEPKKVARVCRGEQLQHQGKIFKYLDDIKETNK